MGSRQMLDKVSNGIALRKGKIVKRKLRSGISMVLFFAIMVTSVIPVMAQETENIASEESVAPPTEMVGLDNFITRYSDGTLHLDSKAAISAGYSESIVIGLVEYLEETNQLVLSNQFYTDENLVAHSYENKARHAVCSCHGERKIERYWWGQVDYYLKACDAKAVYTWLEKAGM